MRFPISAGMGPVRSLANRWSSFRFVRFPISGGIVPVRSFWIMSRLVRLPPSTVTPYQSLKSSMLVGAVVVSHPVLLCQLPPLVDR